MELYMAKLATMINPFTKGCAHGTQESSTAENQEREFTLFPALPTELRIKIWAFCFYVPQPPRIVEVRTSPHDNCPNHEGFCPRYSPTCKHPLINTTHEARSVTHFEASKAGHLIFSSTSPSTFSPSAEIIIFNPARDLLFLPSESLPLPLTRGPLGTYTQYKKRHSPVPYANANAHAQTPHYDDDHTSSPPPSSPLRFLALSLERHGTQFNPMRVAIHDFPCLQDLLLVAPDWRSADEVSGLADSLQFLMGAWERRQLEAWRRVSEPVSRAGARPGTWKERGLRGGGAGGRVVLAERMWPRVRVAVRCERGRFDFAKGGVDGRGLLPRC